jgi:hypothetical protein
MTEFGRHAIIERLVIKCFFQGGTLGSILTLPPELDAYISAAMFIIGAYLLPCGSAWWCGTFRDIRLRTRDVLAQVLATLMVAVLTLPGLLVYVLLRPHNTLAGRVRAQSDGRGHPAGVGGKPHLPLVPAAHRAGLCGLPQLPPSTQGALCGLRRLLNLDWDVCPYCGRYRDQSAPEAYDHDHEHEVETPEMGAARPGPPWKRARRSNAGPDPGVRCIAAMASLGDVAARLRRWNRALTRRSRMGAPRSIPLHFAPSRLGDASLPV